MNIWMLGLVLQANLLMMETSPVVVAPPAGVVMMQETVPAEWSEPVIDVETPDGEPLPAAPTGWMPQPGDGGGFAERPVDPAENTLAGPDRNY